LTAKRRKRTQLDGFFEGKPKVGRSPINLFLSGKTRREKLDGMGAGAPARVRAQLDGGKPVLQRPPQVELVALTRLPAFEKLDMDAGRQTNGGEPLV
jgi:hypothetical protein